MDCTTNNFSTGENSIANILNNGGCRFHIINIFSKCHIYCLSVCPQLERASNARAKILAPTTVQAPRCCCPKKDRPTLCSLTDHRLVTPSKLVSAYSPTLELSRSTLSSSRQLGTAQAPLFVLLGTVAVSSVLTSPSRLPFAKHHEIVSHGTPCPLRQWASHFVASFFPATIIHLADNNDHGLASCLGR